MHKHESSQADDFKLACLGLLGSFLILLVFTSIISLIRIILFSFTCRITREDEMFCSKYILLVSFLVKSNLPLEICLVILRTAKETLRIEHRDLRHAIHPLPKVRTVELNGGSTRRNARRVTRKGTSTSWYSDCEVCLLKQQEMDQ